MEIWEFIGNNILKAADTDSRDEEEEEEEPASFVQLTALPSSPWLIKSTAPCRIIRILIQSEFQELVCLVTCQSVSACHISGDRWLYLICFKQFHWVLVYKSFRNGIDTRRLS